jgi:hypothetical protein
LPVRKERDDLTGASSHAEAVAKRGIKRDTPVTRDTEAEPICLNPIPLTLHHIRLCQHWLPLHLLLLLVVLLGLFIDYDIHHIALFITDNPPKPDFRSGLGVSLGVDIGVT